MKKINLLLIGLVFLFNVFFAQPSWAGSKLSKNPDYIELTQNLNQLIEAKNNQTLPEGLNLADVDQKIAELKFQKYIIESGEDTTIVNNSGQPLAVYGPKGKKSTSTFDNVLYVLPDGEETDDDEVFQGIYLPKDAKVSGLTLDGAAVAAKIIPGSRLVVTADPTTGALDFNLPVSKVFKAGEVNWEIPDLAAADLATQKLPRAAID